MKIDKKNALIIFISIISVLSFLFGSLTGFYIGIEYKSYDLSEKLTAKAEYKEMTPEISEEILKNSSYYFYIDRPGVAYKITGYKKILR